MRARLAAPLTFALFVVPAALSSQARAGELLCKADYEYSIEVNGTYPQGACFYRGDARGKWFIDIPSNKDGLLMDLTDPGAAAIAARLDAIAGEPRAPRVVAITPSSEEDKAAFQWKTNPAFAVEHVDFALLNPPGQKPLYRRLPRYFMVAGERVVAVYDDAPPAASDLISSEAS